MRCSGAGEGGEVEFMEHPAHIEKRIQRWKDFYRVGDGKTDVLFLVNYHAPDSPPSPPLWPELKQERIEWSWQTWLRDMEKSTWLEDDAIPCMMVLKGTEVFAECFGCEAHRPLYSYTGAKPMVFSPKEAAKVRTPRLEDTPLMMYFEMADELRARAGRDVIFRIPGIPSPMDIVAQIWDKSDLFPTMLEDPEAVMDLAARVRPLLVAFIDEWFRRYGTEFIGHYPAYYMEGGLSITVDEIGNFSSDMYREFVEEDLRMLSQRYGGLGIHCCANSRHQWENLSRLPGLRLLNLCRPEKTLWESYTYFRDITAMWPEKMEHNVPEPMVNPPKAALPEGVHVILSENAATRDDALRIAERLHREYR